MSWVPGEENMGLSGVRLVFRMVTHVILQYIKKDLSFSFIFFVGRKAQVLNYTPSPFFFFQTRSPYVALNFAGLKLAILIHQSLLHYSHALLCLLHAPRTFLSV